MVPSCFLYYPGPCLRTHSLFVRCREAERAWEAEKAGLTELEGSNLLFTSHLLPAGKKFSWLNRICS